MIRFTKTEVRDLLISFIVISLSFAILFTGRNLASAIYILPIAMVGVGAGFILHELGHKFASIHFGYWAEYKLWPAGLVIALVSSFFGFVFAAPGAVYTYGNFVSERENGIISISGPIVNIILALIFLGVAVFIYPAAFYSGSLQIAFLVCSLGFSINSYLAVFNLIPVWNLDGSKVLRWNGLIWVITIAIAGIMTYFSMTIGVENIVRAIIGL
ncbi:MAG: site-2 protease family protein [Methanobrevibacter sp.]|uniref:site-2 protease family protein n=1 Tax=Methanobrevibacter sp. TaxID=66852 RepID=UPI0026DF6400|nr:site-2 protease family protein [Methanobrevibacter sp.]MDO5848941.1 site-2 protease family protein [Methanobrevibacter sp.]